MGSEHKQLIDYVHISAKEDYENIIQNIGRSFDYGYPLFKKFCILTSKDFSLGLKLNSYSSILFERCRC